jgi:hypothetical protein
VYDLPDVDADDWLVEALDVAELEESWLDEAWLDEPAVNTLPGWIKSEPPFNERASDTEIPKAFATLYKPSPDLTVYDLPDVDAEDEPVLALELDEEVVLVEEVVDWPALNTWPGWIKSEPPFNERASDTEILRAFATLYKPSPDLTVYDLPDVEADELVLALALDEEDELDVEVADWPALNTWPGWIKLEVKPFCALTSATVTPKARATVYKPSPDLTV